MAPEPAAALLALLYGAGLRRAELVGLDLDDFSQKEGTVRVRGKGSKVRLVPLPAGTRKALASWLRHRGDKPGPLLLPVRANGELLAHRRLSPQAVYNLLLRIAQRAELLHFRPHDLRRTFIGDLLEAGADLEAGKASLRELHGLIGAHEWRKKGVDIPALGARIHPHYGVFSPVRGEYLQLVADAPLPAMLAAGGTAFDIGTGTGVLAAVLARRGLEVVATDTDSRALACAADNLARLGLAYLAPERLRV